MTQFVENGPEIPDRLLQAHEDGRVVFFCGAGISYPAKLPGFGGLVSKVYKKLGTKADEIEKAALNSKQFDAVLSLLEQRVVGQRLAVRRAISRSLKPKLGLKGATTTHEALLDLAIGEDGSTRLVTTNFDRIFETVIRRRKQSLRTFQAPLLPIPKASRWNGLVYLHGLLPKNDDADALQRLVVTSGDFGLAYLTERWASRFVSELFRNYVVCFVGYSIDDPVMRYMMDALAADRMLGERPIEAYAFGSHDPGEAAAKGKQKEWAAKSVTPILYECPTPDDHSLLHRTLEIWAETYRDGILGKEKIVGKLAASRPSMSTKQDDFVGRMLWALTDQTGLPAKHFANVNPVPPLDWLAAFDEKRFGHTDLERFGIRPSAGIDDSMAFSLSLRPTPYTHSSWMALTKGWRSSGKWDAVMIELANWLVRHLDNPNLLIFLADRGGQLHEQFIWILERQLDQIVKWEQQGEREKLDELKANSPDGIPRPEFRVLWRLITNGFLKDPWVEVQLHDWMTRLRRDGLNPSLRMEFRRMLAPRIKLRKPFQWPLDDDRENDSSKRRAIETELVLNADHVRSGLEDLRTDEKWRDVLSDLFADIELALLDVLNLMQELGQASQKEDHSFIHLPSISEHWQNRGFEDWAALIELLRDSWLLVAEQDGTLGAEIAQRWLNLPFAVFKRLAFFAASKSAKIGQEIWVSWLLSEDAWWLWSVVTKREVMRLLTLKGGALDADYSLRLEASILKGPPRAMYKDDLEEERWKEIVDREVWLRLAKLEAGRGKLEDIGSKKLRQLSRNHPAWHLAENERDEFSSWMSGTGDPDFEEQRQIDVAPNFRKDLVEWLERQPVEKGYWDEDTWPDLCRERFYLTFSALHELSRKDVWPAERWKAALHAWSDQKHHGRGINLVSSCLQAMPSQVFEEALWGAAWWIESQTKNQQLEIGEILPVCRRIFESTTEEVEDVEQSINHAINEPSGLATTALLNAWFASKPSDNDELPQVLASEFASLCDPNERKFRSARIILASRSIALFRVDPIWTKKFLLPLFDWKTLPAEAQVVWQGFLWSPRLYWPFLNQLKVSFLSTAVHYDQLGDVHAQYANLLSYAALEPSSEFQAEDYEMAVAKLPIEGLKNIARSLAQAQEGAGEKREPYWRNRVAPFWKRIWPKSQELATAEISESIARLAIATDGAFPEAMELLSDWLRKIEHPHFTVHMLHSSDLPSRFPKEALVFLDRIIDDQMWPPRELGATLDLILAASPDLADDNRFRRLHDYARKS